MFSFSDSSFSFTDADSSEVVVAGRSLGRSCLSRLIWNERARWGGEDTHEAFLDQKGLFEGYSTIRSSCGAKHHSELFFSVGIHVPIGTLYVIFVNWLAVGVLTTLLQTYNTTTYCITAPCFCLVCGDNVPWISSWMALNLREDTTTKQQQSHYKLWFLFCVVLLMQLSSF